MDEATSALDNKTQNIVSESLDKLQATRIVIAHRLSTILNSDNIYVVDNGKIIDSGKAVARQTMSVLEKNMLLNEKPPLKTNRFYTNGKEKVIASLLKLEAVSLQKLEF